MDPETERLVKKIAFKLFRQYCPRGASGFFTREDILHYGVIGLLKAEKKFDKKMNVPFQAYAGIRIHGEIMDAIRKSPEIRLPQEKSSQFKRLSKAKKTLQDQGETPDPEALAQELGWNVKTVLKVENFSNRVVSVDAQPGYKEPAGGDRSGNAEKKTLDKDLAAVMQRCLEALDDAAERLILVARELKNMKLRQLAQKFGWSIEKVRQKQISAKQSMKVCLEKNGWDLT